MTIQAISRAAQSNHGITLQPAQAQDVLQTFINMQQAMQSLQMRMDALTDMAVVFIERLGGKVTLLPEDVDKPHNGFDVNWDEEKNVIKVQLSPLEVPEVPVDDGTAPDSGTGLAPVPEGDGDGLAEDTTEEGVDEDSL